MIFKNWTNYQLGMWFHQYIKHTCQLCHTNSINPNTTTLPLPSNGLLCSSCQQSITWLPEPLQITLEPINQQIQNTPILYIQPSTYYDYPIKQAITAFKYQADMSKLPLMVHLLRQFPIPKHCHQENSIIIPMPTTNKRILKKGFDPVILLARYLSKHWNIPIWQGIERIDDTKSQQGLNRIQRLQNIKNAFQINEVLPVKNILLFDDVSTTGASLKALASTLYHHNLNTKIFAYCLAHGTNLV